MTTRGFSYLRMPDEDLSPPLPLSIERVKDHLGIDDFDDYDNVIDDVLSSAIEEVEEFLCVSLTPNLVTVRWEELTTDELPYGPVNEIISVQDGNGGGVTGYQIEGLIGGFVDIKANRANPTVVKYKAGYAEGKVPNPIILSILKLAVTNFEQRTDFDLSGKVSSTPLPNDWRKTCMPYRRITWAG